MKMKRPKYQPSAESVIAFRNFLATILGQKYLVPLIFILLILFILVSAWLPELLTSFFSENIKIFIQIATVALFFLILIIYGNKAKKFLSPIKVLADDNNPPIAKVLLIFLSPLGGPGNTRRSLLDNHYNTVNDPNSDENAKLAAKK